ncbi:ABC transporter permease [Marinoscillum furvescens]|uniref:Putative ABC transport system permease protein n=1 Tax=Marinoscillum furvescens DSM 4134 TaxID=1122208 RepID=A0A3D9LG20_MARFU|nr:ABC transporter permease [Marinoscillum furvescens]REE05578.1 putative ABC transport system permease protein [Marinoscillum furvescens DSM 4134]
MIWNYLKVTYRTFLRQKVYSLINVTGLAIGLACFVLIYLYISDELSYDKFHEKSHRTYRLIEHFESEGVGEHSASQPFPVGPTLKNDFSRQIETYVRLFNFQSPSLALANRKLDKSFNESRIFFADSTFFEVFDFELIKGSKATALDEPNSILLTESMVEKYFDGEDPMGQLLEFQGNQNLKVTGVLADAPLNAHFQFDFIGSFSSLKSSFGGGYPRTWYWNPCWTYVVLDENTQPDHLEEQFPAFVKKYFPGFIVDDVTLELQPLEDIHLHSRLDYEILANGNEANLKIFGLVAIFVLLIASINFINLSTARASKRAKEVGVRKSLGSGKKQLIRQFVFESVLLTALAVVFAILIVGLVLPSFNQLTEKAIDVAVLAQVHVILGLVVLTLVVGVLSGFYPAFVLSSFNTVLVLKNAYQRMDGFSFRRVLVTVQFAISIMLIIGTIIAMKQLQFLQNDELGFSKDHVVMLPVIRSPMAKHYEQFKNRALQSPRVHSVTAVEEIVGAKHQVANFQFEGVDQSKPYPRFVVRHDFTETMGIEMAAGRDFSYEVQTDDSLALVVNETLVRSMNWGSPEEAINRRFMYRGQLRGKVVGVVKDYNFVSKHHPIAPLVITLNSHPGAFNLFVKYVAVKIDGADMRSSIEDIREAWYAVMPERPFDYFFLDDRLNDSYKAEQKLSVVTMIFSGLAIIVACLGLFGLATYSVEQRKKEIGVRKVLGISTSQILMLLSKEFVLLICLAFVVAVPSAYVLLRGWLDGFAFRTDIDAWPFVAAGVLTMLVAVFTISFHAFRASRINPAETLKYE